ncbi:MAG: ATP-dependent helicase [bacterium]|nr:ATP-dependent helicase [bacterium]
MSCYTMHEIISKLSAEQRRAATHGAGPMLVSAGPGSGKTTVLTGRILHLVQERRIPPEQILVITFTREAARSMQSRYLSMAGKSENSSSISTDICSGQVNFGTFHSFFYQILRSSEKYTQYRIIGETDKQKLLYPLLEQIRERQPDAVSPYYDLISPEEISRILSVISCDKNKGVGWELGGERLQEPWKACYGEIWQYYERQKARRKQMDLDDLLTLTAAELESNAELLQYWRRNYRYVLIDEFQDCNTVQYEIIKKLFTVEGNVFAVGDDDQAIYGFRGADPEIMPRFLTEYQGVAYVSLGRNYRCLPAIVDASDRVISCNRHRIPKRLAPVGESGGSVKLKAFAGEREERQYVISMCQGKSIRELSGWAVLFRTNGLLGVFAAELLAAGIPLAARNEVSNIYEHFVARDVMDYLRIAHGCRERKILLRIWNRPRLQVGRESMVEPTVDFDELRQFYSHMPYENPTAVRDLDQFERKLGQLRKFSPELSIAFIRRGFGYEDYLRRRAGQNRELLESWLEILDWLEEEGKEYRDFAEWESYQKRYSRQLAQQKILRKEQQKGIHLLTMHAAKGLEYDKVFLMDVNEGNIPKLKKGILTTEAQTEEERRLFYVGMTRARNSLELLYLTGTMQRPKLPSSFLQPLTEGQISSHQT